ncbi:unnamed protein product [Cuscuta europaea]|uniref:F-box domain-containing protein n=1 Tax=Cuscuta europaea TaxID=41803 RepID=A0A9P0YR23_CUSEU|nr:unnamed protein product [Cuscuta europaea]
MENHEAACCWENLPELCVSMVLDKLESPRNLFHFGAVCKQWQSLFKSYVFDTKKKRAWRNYAVPMLLVPHHKSWRKKRLYSLQAEKEVSVVKLRQRYAQRCCSSCYGWLATVNRNAVITLSNPFKDDVPNILLPELKLPQRKPRGHQYDIVKVVLSADPCSGGGFVVGVIYTVYKRVAFHKSGEKEWVYVDMDLWVISDITFHRNLVYIMGHRTNVISIDLYNGSGSPPPKLKTVVPEPPLHDLEAYSDRAYLVESSKGNLYSIHRKRDGDAHLTKRFEVMRLVLDENGELLEKKEVKSIDGDVVFVGDSVTMAVSAAKYFPQGKPNSIYYTDDYIDLVSPYGPQDNGIFHLDDDTGAAAFGQHYPFQSSHSHLPPYIWILPPIGYLLQLDIHSI